MTEFRFSVDFNALQRYFISDFLLPAPASSWQAEEGDETIRVVVIVHIAGSEACK